MAFVLVGDNSACQISQAFTETFQAHAPPTIIRRGTFAQITCALSGLSPDFASVVFEGGFAELTTHWQFMSSCPPQPLAAAIIVELMCVLSCMPLHENYSVSDLNAAMNVIAWENGCIITDIMRKFEPFDFLRKFQLNQNALGNELL